MEWKGRREARSVRIGIGNGMMGMLEARDVMAINENFKRSIGRR